MRTLTYRPKRMAAMLGTISSYAEASLIWDALCVSWCRLDPSKAGLIMMHAEMSRSVSLINKTVRTQDHESHDFPVKLSSEPWKSPYP